MKKRRIVVTVLALTLLTLVFVLVCNSIVERSARPGIYASLDSLPSKKVGLLLGTSPYLGNLYFKYRIEAAATLFHTGKIKHLIVSGDNHTEGYDEATAMKKALINAGVPDSCITLDYAGFRTLDSIIRCKEVFGQDEFVVISQEFHNERALFIAGAYGIKAVGFNARSVDASYGFKTEAREYLARVKCILDIYLLHTRPHFLGDKIHLNV